MRHLKPRRYADRKISMPLPPGPSGISWKDFVRSPAPRTRQEVRINTAAATPVLPPTQPLVCRAAVARPRDPPVSESYVVPYCLRPKPIPRPENSDKVSAKKNHSKVSAKFSFRAWETRKKKENIAAKKQQRREAKMEARKQRNAERRLERRRKKLAHDQSVKAMRDRVSRIKFVEKENKARQRDARAEANNQLTSAHCKLRKLKATEWLLKKDLEEERRRIREVLEEEKLKRRLKQERIAKWSQKAVRLSYSIRG